MSHWSEAELQRYVNSGGTSQRNLPAERAARLPRPGPVSVEDTSTNVREVSSPPSRQATMPLSACSCSMSTPNRSSRTDGKTEGRSGKKSRHKGGAQESRTAGRMRFKWPKSKNDGAPLDFVESAKRIQAWYRGRHAAFRHFGPLFFCDRYGDAAPHGTIQFAQRQAVPARPWICVSDST